jgi:hypothetical protein
LSLEHYFDAIYYALNALLLASLVVAVVLGVVRARRSDAPADRSIGIGVRLIAGGTIVALVGGLLADALLRDSPLFQQARFALYYVGFGMLLLGTVHLLRSRASARWLPRSLLVISVVALLVGATFLAVPSTFVMNQFHEQVQLVVYWLPMLVASGPSAIALALSSVGDHGIGPRQFRLVAAFEVLLFLGLLREAEILPDLGDPLLNLCVSFVPFVFGGVLLVVASALGIRRNEATPGGLVP